MLLSLPVTNIHQRELNASASTAGDLIDRLASERDELWPSDRWPPMRLDRPLGVGAVGGHGPIGYRVEDYEPGRNIRFRFTKPAEFLGTHRFEIDELSDEQVILRHIIEMRVYGRTYLSWLFVIRPLHNALIEDALDRAQRFVEGTPRHTRWSRWVRFLRWMVKKR